MNKIKLVYENGDTQELDADPDGLLVVHDPANTYVTGSASLSGVVALELKFAGGDPEPEPEPEPEPVPNATEAALAVAQANEIDITTVEGTGPDGQVTANDVELVATELAQKAAEQAAQPADEPKASSKAKAK
jgi:pyruvate/2-oxoglutarate dehydrogenase complex dihydrolipoamide acyltransferase (E2) component